MIVLDRNELMSTRMRHSEEQLATLALDALDTPSPRMLVGGYGMGFTLRAGLAHAGEGARFTVAELIPAIIGWARGPLAELTDGCLDDSRVDLRIEDVGQLIARVAGSGGARYDAILLDVDNGPDALVHQSNRDLYTDRALGAARGALRPGGVLAIWSAAPDPRFTKQLERAGFDVEERTVRARPGGKGPRHTIWLARRPVG